MPYICPKVEQLHNTPLVGTHQCVALLQHYADLPNTACWRAGEPVRGNAALQSGIAIATFVEGRYPNRAHGNHAAFYLGQDADGIWVMDQWANDPIGKPHVSRRHVRWKGRDPSGQIRDPSNNGDAYAVIEHADV